MANVSNGLTEKMKAFCCEYVANGGNGTQAYLTAYNSNSDAAASIEASKLLNREDIKEYITALNKPMREKAISERDKKRSWLWSMIENAPNDNDKLRAMDILNRMDSEYQNININENRNAPDLSKLDITALKDLV